MWWKGLTFILMTAVIIAAFILPSPMAPGVSLGDAEVYRIFYFHVPQAWVAVLAFIVSMINSILFLKSKNMEYDLRAVNANKLGLLFAVLATVTGSIFAKITWGEFWNWSEIREVTIFILLLIYGAYFALRSALPNPETRANLSSVMSIIFAASAVFLVFVLPRVYAVFSQHPSDSVIDSSGTLTMGATVYPVFFGSLAAFTLLFIWIFNITNKITRMENRE
jgi:heme exporter protein C